MTWAAVAIGGASLVGGILGSNASKKASKQQAQAAQQAAALQQQQYQTTRQDLMPWQQSGKAALSELDYLLGLRQPAQQQASMPTREQFTKTTPGAWIPNAYQGNQYASKAQTGQRLPGTTTFDQAGFDAAMAAYQPQQSQDPSDPRFGSLLRPFGLDQFQESPAYRFNLEQGLDAINKATRASRQSYNPATLRDIGKYAQGVASNEFLNAYNMYGQDQENVYRRLFGLSQSGQNAATQVGNYGAGAAGAAGGFLTDAGTAQSAGTIGQANAWSGALQGGTNAFLQANALKNFQQPNYVPQGVQFNPASASDMERMLGAWA